MYVEDLGDARWQEIVDEETWHLLARLAAGGELGESGKRKVGELRESHPTWRLVVDERSEFSVWTEHGLDRPVAATPEALGDLIEWLRDNPESRPGEGDDWGRRCRDDYGVATSALRALADERWWKWRWIEALNVWAQDEKLAGRSWTDMRAVLRDAPDVVLGSGGMSFWLKNVGGVVDSGDEQSFLELCGRALELAEDEPGTADNPVNRALNRPGRAGSRGFAGLRIAAASQRAGTSAGGQRPAGDGVRHARWAVPDRAGDGCVQGCPALHAR